MSCTSDMQPWHKPYKYKVPTRRASEVDQRPETQTRQVSKTFSECDGRISDKLVRFYYTMSPYTCKNDVCLTGMITIFIRFRQQFINSLSFKFASKLANYFRHKTNETTRFAKIFKLLIPTPPPPL